MFKTRHARGLVAAAAMLGATFPAITVQAQSAPAEAEDVCQAPVARPYVMPCRQAAPFLGRWTSLRHGGEIEIVLTRDGTLSGTIVAGNRVMRENGFAPGTQVLRGWRPTRTGGTWQASASTGESFSAIKPGRRPGEPFGLAAWNRGGVLYIAKAQPNRLGMPAMLEGRTSNYDPWIRRTALASD